MSRKVRMFSAAMTLLAIGFSVAAVLAVLESPHGTMGGVIAAGLSPFVVLVIVLCFAWSW